MESSPAATVILTSDDDDDIWSPSRSALYGEEEHMNWEDPDHADDDDDVQNYSGVVWMRDSSTQTELQNVEVFFSLKN